MKLIGRGAEAEIWQIDNSTLKKLRLPKLYRIGLLDTRLRKSRNRREFKVLTKLNKLEVNVPKNFEVFETGEEIAFSFERIEGEVLKKILNKKLLFRAFEQIMKMHKSEVVHGDLTTLNMMERKGEIYLIDFGLSEFSHKIEDRAVDLNLFFTCIKNEHPNFFMYKNALLKKYAKLEFGEKVCERLKKIEMRGRNK